jgi:hypothetical protein
MISFLIALSIVFSSVLAAIIGECVATLPGNYTLAALNTTLPNTNATGLPLMVAHTSTDHSFMFYQIVVRYYHFHFLPSVSVPHRHLHFALCPHDLIPFQTRASYRYSDIVPDLTLSAYGLIAKGPSNHASVADLASETRLPVTLYETSSSLPEIVPAPVFCAMVSSIHPVMSHITFILPFQVQSPMLIINALLIASSQRRCRWMLPPRGERLCPEELVEDLPRRSDPHVGQVRPIQRDAGRVRVQACGLL